MVVGFLLPRLHTNVLFLDSILPSDCKRLFITADETAIDLRHSGITSINLMSNELRSIDFDVLYIRYFPRSIGEILRIRRISSRVRYIYSQKPSVITGSEIRGFLALVKEMLLGIVCGCKVVPITINFSDGNTVTSPQFSVRKKFQIQDDWFSRYSEAVKSIASAPPKGLDTFPVIIVGKLSSRRKKIEEFVDALKACGVTNVAVFGQVEEACRDAGFISERIWRLRGKLARDRVFINEPHSSVLYAMSRAKVVICPGFSEPFGISGLEASVFNVLVIQGRLNGSCGVLALTHVKFRTFNECIDGIRDVIDCSRGVAVE